MIFFLQQFIAFSQPHQPIQDYLKLKHFHNSCKNVRKGKYLLKFLVAPSPSNHIPTGIFKKSVVDRPDYRESKQRNKIISKKERPYCAVKLQLEQRQSRFPATIHSHVQHGHRDHQSRCVHHDHDVHDGTLRFGLFSSEDRHNPCVQIQAHK